MSKSAKNEEEVMSWFSPWLTPLTYFLFCYIILPFYFRLEVNGREHLPKEGATILAPTHRSRWDGIILGFVAGWFAMGRPLRYVVLEDQRKGFQGWFLRRLGGFPLDRDRPSIASIRYSIQILRNREVLALFPEGHIFLDNEIHPMQPGVARIALQAASGNADLNLKIVPISIRYEYPAPPPWRSSVRVNIGSPLDVNNYCGESSKEGANKLTADIEASLKKLHG